MTNAVEIPKGYMQDANGNLVPVANIQPLDMERDKLVKKLIAKAKSEQGRMEKLRGDAMSDIDKFVEKAAKKFGTTLGGKKGNLQLISFCGQYKVQVSQGTDIWFNEHINVAQKLIMQCIDEWSDGANPNLRVVVDQAFQQRDDGSYTPSKILGLRKLKINGDTKVWNRAMRALGDAIETGIRKPYLRFYKKGSDDSWVNIPLDMAKLGGFE